MEEMEASLRKALKELESKTLNDIQYDTAITWCGRACAASMLGLMADAKEYAHEAIEHAALSKSFELLYLVQNYLDSYRVDY